MKNLYRQKWAHVFTNWSPRRLQRGAAALEFALVLPVLLMLLVGIVDFGMLMGAQAQLSNAAREGARSAALTGKDPLAKAAATAGMSGMPGVGHAVTNVVCTTTTGTACFLTDAIADTGSMVTVTITYTHTWLSPVIIGLSPTITLHGESRMRIEA